VRKSWDSDGNLDLNDQPTSGRPASANHNLNRQKTDKLIQENWLISQTAIEEKLNTGLASASDTAAVWVTEMSASWVLCQLMLEMKSKTGSMALITHSIW